MDYVVEKDRLDQLVKQGRHKQVYSELERFRSAGLPRELVADFANMARRAGYPGLCLKILHPFIRPEALQVEEATPKEIAIYAAALARIGAVTEALSLLAPLEKTRVPEVLLYLAFTYIHRWDYENSARVLKIYLQNKALTSYERTLGQLNLLAAYQFLDSHVAEESLLEEAIGVCRLNGWPLLERNALHVAAQSALARKDWSQTDACLKAAENLAQANGFDFFLVRKWRALLELHREGPLPSSLAGIQQIRAEAAKNKDFETLRDCDYYTSLFTKNVNLYFHVYFGTPFALYRRRMEREGQTWIEFPNSFTRQMTDQQAPCVFNMTEAREQSLPGKESVFLTQGSVVHRLFQILASDFYRPFQIAGIFNLLYPNEIVDPYSSADRVKAVVKRLRQWFVNSNLPLQILNHERDYYLSSSAPYGLEINLNGVAAKTKIQSKENSSQIAMALLKEKWTYRAFSSSQAAEFLGRPRQEVLALLRSAVDAGAMYRSGTGRSTIFRFAK